MGAHRIPDSNVIISGHQIGGSLGAVFGLFGMLPQSAANADTTEKAVGHVEDSLRFDVRAKATEFTSAILADETYAQKVKMTPNGGASTLSVMPNVVITFENETEVRPYVVLKVTLASGSPSDTPRVTKYFCCEGKPLPLTGVGGLSENSGERLKAILTAELDTAIHVMLLDHSPTSPRGR